MEFLAVAQAFEQIEQVSSRLEMTQQLATLLKQATPVEARLIAYLSLGQMHAPYLEVQFNLADNNVNKVIARLLGESEAHVTAAVKKVGDSGLLFEQGSWKTKEHLTVKEVYKALEHIAQLNGIGSQEEKSNQLEGLLKSLDPLAAKYVVRIILGKLRLGFSDMTLIDALSWMLAGDKSLRKELEEAYNLCADIGLITERVKKDGVSALDTMQITVGVPIRPAAAERLPNAKAIIEKIGPCIAQPKLDGFRIQIHLDKTGPTPIVRFFSRNLLDMSAMFPDLTQEILKLKVDELICEGEAIVFNGNTGDFLPFQETVRRKRKHGLSSRQVCATSYHR